MDWQWKSGATDEITYVVLDGLPTVIRIDHEAKRQYAWSLRGEKWVEANIADALFEGRVVTVEYLGALPELPEL